MADRGRPDQNNNFSIFAVSNADGQSAVSLWADPVTHALVTSSGGGSSTQYAEDVTTSPATGDALLGRYSATPPTLTDGQMKMFQLDSAGNLKVTGSLSVGGTTDNSAYTAGTSTGTPTMGFYHSTIDAVTDGRAATVGITAKRALLVNLQNASGTEIGTASTPVQVSLANTGSNATAVAVSGTVGISASSTAAITSVASSATSVALLSSNTGRKSATFFNESTATLYLAFAATSSLTAYTVQIPPASFYELSINYTGAISGIWSTANGSVRITELT